MWVIFSRVKRILPKTLDNHFQFRYYLYMTAMKHKATKNEAGNWVYRGYEIKTIWLPRHKCTEWFVEELGGTGYGAPSLWELKMDIDSAISNGRLEAR